MKEQENERSRDREEQEEIWENQSIIKLIRKRRKINKYLNRFINVCIYNKTKKNWVENIRWEVVYN